MVEKTFRNLKIYDDYGSVSQEIIFNFEKEFDIKLPLSYISLVKKYNGVWFKESDFEYLSQNGKRIISSLSFDSFETKDNIEPMNNILRQYIYDDEIYGYKNVYSFGYTGNGDFVCFDYRDDPKGNEPKICIVIHDEYDEKTGKRLLFPVAENFEAFLDMLYDFDERYPNGYE
ncbi:TPA: SMI1/KNR4 family protein [Pasteurella multocida]|nr:SMI1/KNR4 family protein [Pasteurella multocida]